MWTTCEAKHGRATEALQSPSGADCVKFIFNILVILAVIDWLLLAASHFSNNDSISLWPAGDHAVGRVLSLLERAFMPVLVWPPKNLIRMLNLFYIDQDAKSFLHFPQAASRGSPLCASVLLASESAGARPSAALACAGCFGDPTTLYLWVPYHQHLTFRLKGKKEKEKEKGVEHLFCHRV